MATTISKLCEQCNQSFNKPDSCSLLSWSIRKYCTRKCFQLSKLGQTAHNKGVKRPDLVERNESRRVYRRCCMCDGPTKYPVFKRGSKHNKIPRRCDSKACIKAMREKKNKRIAKARRREWRSGQRVAVPNACANVSRISKEEQLMMDWFVAQGWEPQYYINTGVHSRTTPYCYKLDFALVKNKLYVEIDGSVHRGERLLRDARRTDILSGLGWHGLRIAANRIISKLKRKPTTDIEGVKKEVLLFSKMPKR